MKTIFKKSLVAAALAAAAFNASAVVVTATPAVVSLEGAVNQASIAVPAITATAGAQYTVGDTITFTFTGAELDTALIAPTLTATLAGGDTATLGFVGATASTVTFRITAQTDGAADGVSYTGATFVTGGLVFKTSTVVDAKGDIKVKHGASNVTGSIVIDNLGTQEATVVSVVEQFTSSVTTKLDGIIDVGQSRQKFVGATTDVLVVTPVEAAAATHDATYKTLTHVVKGDFSFADANKNGTVTTAELNAAVAVANTGTATGDTIAQHTLNAALTELTVVVTEAGAANTPGVTTFTFTEPGVATTKPVLVPGAFTQTTSIKYAPATGADVTKATETAASAGAWTLNGATVQVPYLVFGTVGGKAYNTIVQLNNASSVSGDVFVDVFKEDGTQVLANKKVATVAGQSTTNIAGAIKTELEAAGASNAKVSVKVVANVPESTATVYSAFVDGVTGERIIVNNDSKVQTK